MNRHRAGFGLMSALLFSLLVVSGVYGQTSSLSGFVSDPQGLLLPGATLTATNTATGASRTAVSSQEGVYQFPQLPPGKYRVRAEAKGFTPVVLENVEVRVSSQTTLKISFQQVGGSTETITVQGDLTPINTTDATIGNTFNEPQIRMLPLEGRNVVGLLALQPGVVYTGIEGDMRSGAVNGARSDQANVTLDGVDVNAQQTGQAFTSVLRLTLDSVQEFRVTTSNPNAEQGRSSGAQIGLVTKSGTNDLHGSLYEFHRNTVTTANDFFNNKAGIARPALLRNVFGGALGGPIKRNRAFFFFNYEGRRDRSQTSESRIVPTETMKAGQLKFRAVNGTIPTLAPEDIKVVDPLHIGVNPAVLQLLKQYPVGNDPSLGIDQGLNFIGFRFNAPFLLNYNTYIARLDYSLTNDGKHNLFWRGNYQQDRQTRVAPQFPGQLESSTFLNNSKGFVAGYTAVLGARVVNNFRWGLTREGIEYTGIMGSRWGIRSIDDIQNYTGARASGRRVPVHNLTDDISWIHGTHNMQIGANVIIIRNNQFTFTNSFPDYWVNDGWMKNLGRDILPAVIVQAGAVYTSAARNPIVRTMMGLLGVTAQKSATYFYDKMGTTLPQGQSQARTFGANEYDLYWQDSWSARPNLTMTFGIRYGYATPPWETSGLQVSPTVNIEDFMNQRTGNMYAGRPSNAVPLLSFDLAGKANDKPGYFPANPHMWAPRVAFAYSPDFDGGLLKTLFGSRGKSSIRGGFAVAYSRLGGALTTTSDLAGAFGLTSTVYNPTLTVDYTTADRFTGFGKLPDSPPAPKGGFPNTPAPDTSSIGFLVDNTLTTPYSLSFNFSVSRELKRSFTVEMAYIGRLGRKLLSKVDLSAPLIYLTDPSSGQNFAQAVGVLEPYINGNVPSSQVPKQPAIENTFPSLATATKSATQVAYEILAANAPSWTDALYEMDVNRGASRFGSHAFFQQQFQSLTTWRNMGSSSYHGLNLLVRKRFSQGFQFDFNYTLSKSIDNGSMIENAERQAGTVPNIFRPQDFFALSDFDIRHQFNANWIVDLPLGKGKKFMRSSAGWLDQIVGGWGVSGLWRYRTGLPVGVLNGFFYPTNYFYPSSLATRIAPVESNITHTDPSGVPNLFADPKVSFNSFDHTSMGGSGSRNILTGDRFLTLDLGLHKSFRLPHEGYRIQFRWEIFNVTNTPSFSQINLNLDDQLGFGRFQSTTGDSSRRVMQFALRFEF